MCSLCSRLQVTGADSIAAVTGAVYIKYNAISKVGLGCGPCASRLRPCQGLAALQHSMQGRSVGCHMHAALNGTAVNLPLPSC